MKKILTFFVFIINTNLFAQTLIDGKSSYIEIYTDKPVVTCTNSDQTKILQQYYDTLYYVYNKESDSLIIKRTFENFSGLDILNQEEEYIDLSLKSLRKILNSKRRSITYTRRFYYKNSYSPCKDELIYKSRDLKLGYINHSDFNNNLDLNDPLLNWKYFNLGQSVYNLPSIIEGKLKELPSN